jgi:cytochrome b subunit of formate dehydrogenase
MPSADDPSSPVFVDRQIATCGHCHPESRQTYDASVHGQGLSLAGLLVTATCSSCHGDHGIFPAADERSKLHVTKVAETCSSCHRFIRERLQKSIHGRDNGLGQVTDSPAPGGHVSRTPNCIDCHQGHDQPNPATARFRRELSSRCGDCHDNLQQQYGLSLHGELTDLGYGPAANCSDCHGDHDVLPVSDPASAVSSVNRLATCQKCHPDAPPKFADFDPHADHRDRAGNPLLYWVYFTLMTLLLTTIGVWLAHSALWFTRSLIELRHHPRPKGLVPGETAYVRFTSFHRLAHVGLLVSFLGLTLTGLPLKYSHAPWAHFLANLLGGFSSTGLWHRIFGLVNFAYLLGYVLWALHRLIVKPRRVGTVREVALGGDSPIPTRRDWTDFAKMMRWFFGRGPKPTFERWAYWEKIDVWGAMADIVIIGMTGMILWFPELITRFLPGQTLNVAKVIHSTQALLATGFVFAIHFFNTHVRPEKFPMDLSMFVGLVSEEEMLEERHDYYERLRREGRLKELQATVPPRRVLRAVTFGGAIAVAIGTALLVGIVVTVVGV